MNMKDHILAALREQFNLWEELLASLPAEQMAAPLLPSRWTTKDVMIHLWAWQQRSIARMDAALLDQEPEFPRWIPGIDPDDEGFTEEINTWIYETYRDLPWSKVHQNWQDGFLRFLESGRRIAERDLLDNSRYPWLGGRSLAAILIASYDHHQEHYEKFQDWLAEH